MSPIHATMPMGQPSPPQADRAIPTLHKPHIAAARRVNILRAMADTLFVEAGRIEGFSRACAASNNPDGEACWKRIASTYQDEAGGFVQQADKLQGKKRMSRAQDQVRALLEEARQCEQESKVCAGQHNFSRASELQAVADFFRNLATKHNQITGAHTCA